MKINKREAIELREQGKTYAEIAVRYGVTRQAVQKLLSKGQTKNEVRRSIYPDIVKNMRMKALTHARLASLSGIQKTRLIDILMGFDTPTESEVKGINFALGKKISWEKG